MVIKFSQIMMLIIEPNHFRKQGRRPQITPTRLNWDAPTLPPPPPPFFPFVSVKKQNPLDYLEMISFSSQFINVLNHWMGSRTASSTFTVHFPLTYTWFGTSPFLFLPSINPQLQLGEKGLSHTRVELSLLQHKSHEIVCTPVITTLSLFDTITIFKDSGLVESKSLEMNRSWTYGVKVFMLDGEEVPHTESLSLSLSLPPQLCLILPPAPSLWTVSNSEAIFKQI